MREAAGGGRQQQQQKSKSKKKNQANLYLQRRQKSAPAAYIRTSSSDAWGESESGFRSRFLSRSDPELESTSSLNSTSFSSSSPPFACASPSSSSSELSSICSTEICFEPLRGGGESDVMPRISGECSGGGGWGRSGDTSGGGTDDIGDCGGVTEIDMKLGSFWNVMMGSPMGVDGTEYGLIEDGAGEGGLGIGPEGGGVGEGALSMRNRRLMMRSGRSGVGADGGGGGRAPFGADIGEARVLGDAGIVGRLGLPLLVLRRCREGRRLVTSSGRGGRAEEGG